MNKIALITGATAGIGEAVAYKLAELNYNLILTGRRNDRLTNLSTSLKSKYEIDILTLNFDIRIREAVKTQIEALPEAWKNIDVLVNNAGLAAGLSTIQEGNIDDWEQMIDTNIKGLLYITRAVSPVMVHRKQGHIINIGSIAGKEVYPNGGVYCSTKFAVDALSKGMRIDMVQSGVKVTAIHPGMVETEFSMVRFKGDQAKADAVYQGLTPLYANDIAEAVVFAITRPSHVNINDMVIMPTAQAAATVVVRD
ncbi:MAG: SDR family NAD(P)-dependent oxidoreductase [Bacteroidales bacterium]|nr:SDR family NAD(P)-dependent oxidoreductase [Bacteroidales bacterium]